MTNAYQVWIYDQIHPDEKLITGRKKKRVFVPKPEPRPADTEAEMLAKERIYLDKHGINF